MYKQFVKNIENFIILNTKAGNTSNYRFEIAESLKNLTDVNKFLELKTVDIDKFNELSNVIWELENNIDKYPAFKVFSWELWGYGFDGKKCESSNKERLSEQLKTIDLLLSTQYWH